MMRNSGAPETRTIAERLRDRWAIVPRLRFAHQGGSSCAESDWLRARFSFSVYLVPRQRRLAPRGVQTTAITAGSTADSIRMSNVALLSPASVDFAVQIRFRRIP